jgi:hypothetical protein
MKPKDFQTPGFVINAEHQTLNVDVSATVINAENKTVIVLLHLHLHLLHQKQPAHL